MKVMVLTDNTFSMDFEDVLANDNYAVAFWIGKGKRNEKELNNPTCLKIKFKDDKIIKLDEFVWDLDHVEEFWT